MATAVRSGPQSATCHASLRYAWAAMEIEAQWAAMTYIGPFLETPPTDKWPGPIAELAAATNVEPGTLREALADVPLLDADRQEQIRRLTLRIAAILAEIGEERLSLLDRLRRVANIARSN
jgi:Sensory domain found in PocR